MKVLHMRDEPIKVLCPYCSHDISKAEWRSEFFCAKHYKTAVCKCGRVVVKDMDFDGSGHDRWNRNEIDMLKGKPSGTIRTIEDKFEVRESPDFISKEVKR